MAGTAQDIPRRSTEVHPFTILSSAHRRRSTPESPASWAELSLLTDQPHPTRETTRRCAEKGCVFPATQPGAGRCLQHDRQHREPDLFGSQQPSMLLLDRAKFGLPDSDSTRSESHAEDRRHMARLWQAFQEGVS